MSARASLQGGTTANIKLGEVGSIASYLSTACVFSPVSSLVCLCVSLSLPTVSLSRFDVLRPCCVTLFALSLSFTSQFFFPVCATQSCCGQAYTVLQLLYGLMLPSVSLSLVVSVH